jgi:hypothetical protein
LNEVANPKADGQSPQAVELPFASREVEAKFRINDTMLRWCFQGLGSRLKALVLTGSLARNEATWLRADQEMRFLSDAEFIIILKDKTEIPSAALVTLICRGAEEELRHHGYLCKLSFGAVHEAFLSNLGNTIFGYELLTCGEVIYGDPDILAKRAGSIADVSQEDAWRMLANRTVELLEIAPELLDGRPALSEAAQYRLTKLYCDMATTILVFKREFVAGYQARAEKLKELHRHGLLSDLPFDADWFVGLVGRCTDYKITHRWDGGSPFTSCDSVQQAVEALRSLWAWELARMHQVETASADIMLDLHMRKQDWKVRLRGWAFVARRRGLLDSLRHGWRWLGLARRASPRYCVYAAGLSAVSSLQLPGAGEIKQAAKPSPAMSQLETGNRLWKTVLSWLPIADIPARAAPDERDVAEAVLWNYREFVVETRA